MIHIHAANTTRWAMPLNVLIVANASLPGGIPSVPIWGQECLNSPFMSVVGARQHVINRQVI